MAAFYNEIDPFAAQWLRNLIAAGHIAPGVVDERSIEDITPEELDGFTQVHFFAGIGGWSLALRMAGWPDDRPVWTGSCPCQPFSSAGKGDGFADERHLWPAFHHLITERRPPVVFGEQVAGKAGRAWLSLVRSDLEGVGYAVGGADLCAAGLGAPHIRQRLYWVADAMPAGRTESGDRPVAGSIRLGFLGHTDGTGPQQRSEATQAHGHRYSVEPASRTGFLAHASALRHDGRRPGEAGDGRDSARLESERFLDAGGRMADTIGGPILKGVPQSGIGTVPSGHEGSRAHFWSDLEWLPCRDGKSRPVEPGLFPLAHGISGRVGKLRASGNAIVPQVAQAFVEAYLEARVTA